MKTSNIIYIILAVIIVAGAGAWFWYNHYGTPQKQGEGQKLVSDVQYYCNNNKTISAQFYNGPPVNIPIQEGQMPPAPNGSVKLVLSDGRKLDLPQTLSGSGIRYANSDESIVFFSDGNGALIMENNQQTYIGCVSVVKDSGGLPQVFESGSQGFSIRYPANYTANQNYQYLALGPGKEIGGVSFVIPASTAKGTNLGSDTYISVEEIPQTTDCNASLFLGQGASTPKTITDNGVDYSYATLNDAGAGNRYDETVYAIPGTNPCIGTRYFIHYSVFENYPPGTVQQFNEQNLINQFDVIRRTLTVQQL